MRALVCRFALTIFCQAIGLFLILLIPSLRPQPALPRLLAPAVLDHRHLPLHPSVLPEEGLGLSQGVGLGHELEDVIINKIVLKDSGQQLARNLVDILLDPKRCQPVLIKKLRLALLRLVVKYYVIHILN